MIIEAMVGHERKLAAQAGSIDPDQEPVPARRQKLEAQRKDLVNRRHALARTVGILRNLARKNDGVIEARDGLAQLAADLDAQAEAASEGRAELKRRADIVRNGWGRFGAIASIDPPLWLSQALPGVDFHRFRNLQAVEEKLAETRRRWLATLSDLSKAGRLPEELEGIADDAGQELRIRGDLADDSLDAEERSRLENLLSLLEAEYSWADELEAARDPWALAEAV